MHLAWQLSNLGRFARNILLIDVPLQLEQNQLISYIFKGLVSDEGIGILGDFGLILALEQDGLCGLGEFLLIGG